MNERSQRRKMTMQEFMQTLDVESAEQASSYLRLLRWTLGVLVGWIVFVEVIGVSIVLTVFEEMALSGSVNYSMSAIWIVLGARIIYVVLTLVFFGVSIFLLDRVNKSKWEAIWCWLLAPFSWFFLYQTISKPLKQAMGQLPLPDYYSDEERAQHHDELRAASHRYWIIFFSVIFGTFFLLFACFLILAIAS